MKIIDISPDELHVNSELARRGRSKSFEDRLRSSIDEIGLAEPLKLAKDPEGGYVIIDGILRFQAVVAIRANRPSRFPTVPGYLFDFDKRFEIRFQSDIYQDLLPSQLATLVEHLHRAENVRKLDIARYIGVSPATLRNYTGLARLLERGGLFGRIVELMDVGVFPASNPYAWLRLTGFGIHAALRRFASNTEPESWIDERLQAARAGQGERYQLKQVEFVTSSLPPDCYRVGEQARAIKRDLGLRRSAERSGAATSDARLRLANISSTSTEPVLRAAADALMEYLR
jgi:hypothetical protein